ncbi:hypothetical protein QBC47DRAFT_105966 [Echria macrotheca]|uniref:Secreted protein n=1 Tax=Echria macrotheca TaxID=438768 RepID=A0AAJ0BJJ3_9PEZI|nr:hypothetical protein QBC47DRAFT_105966 [Echria macrotheca]
MKWVISYAFSLRLFSFVAVFQDVGEREPIEGRIRGDDNIQLAFASHKTRPLACFPVCSPSGRLRMLNPKGDGSTSSGGVHHLPNTDGGQPKHAPIFYLSRFLRSDERVSSVEESSLMVEIDSNLLKKLKGKAIPRWSHCCKDIRCRWDICSVSPLRSLVFFLSFPHLQHRSARSRQPHVSVPIATTRLGSGWMRSSLAAAAKRDEKKGVSLSPQTPTCITHPAMASVTDGHMPLQERTRCGGWSSRPFVPASLSMAGSTVHRMLGPESIA